MLDRPDLPGQPCENRGRQIPHKFLLPHLTRREDIVALFFPAVNCLAPRKSKLPELVRTRNLRGTCPIRLFTST